MVFIPNKEIKVSYWMKIGMCLIFFIPIGLICWALLKQINLQSVSIFVVAVILLLVVIPLFFLFLKFLVLCSVILNKEGVAGVFLFYEGAVIKSKFFSWDEIQTVDFIANCYVFSTETESLKLNLDLFSSRGKTIHDVRALMPKRLLVELNQRD